MSNVTLLRDVLGSETSDKSVHAQALLSVIQNATDDDRADLLCIALEERDSAPKNPKSLPNKGISQDNWDQFVRSHGDMISGHLKMAFSKTSTAKEFAKEILRLINFFQEENERTFVLARVLYSSYIPYHQLPGTPINMTGAEYQQKLASAAKHDELVKYIMMLPFDERTQRASMVLQVLSDIADNGVKVALLAHAFYLQEQRVLAFSRSESR